MATRRNGNRKPTSHLTNLQRRPHTSIHRKPKHITPHRNQRKPNKTMEIPNHRINNTQLGTMGNLRKPIPRNRTIHKHHDRNNIHTQKRQKNQPQSCDSPRHHRPIRKQPRSNNHIHQIRHITHKINNKTKHETSIHKNNHRIPCPPSTHPLHNATQQRTTRRTMANHKNTRQRNRQHPTKRNPLLRIRTKHRQHTMDKPTPRSRKPTLHSRHHKNRNANIKHENNTPIRHGQHTNQLLRTTTRPQNTRHERQKKHHHLPQILNHTKKNPTPATPHNKKHLSSWATNKKHNNNDKNTKTQPSVHYASSHRAADKPAYTTPAAKTQKQPPAYTTPAPRQQSSPQRTLRQQQQHKKHLFFNY